jgi:Dyp-type peroxidase family
MVLAVADPPAARAWLGELATPGAEVTPTVTAVTDWPRPEHCLNVAITADGLRALEVPQASLDSFPAEFLAGAAARAAEVGDVGPNAPEHWIGGFGTTSVHVLVTIHATDRAHIEPITAQVMTAVDSGAFTFVSQHDGDALNGENRTHFGYLDGYSQPRVEGGPEVLPDPLLVAPLGEFVLGYPSQHRDFTFPVPQPEELGRNGSYGVLRIARQDVAGFERFLQSAAEQTGKSVEWVAAKVCGRWRNGVPLSLSPETDAPTTPIALDAMNDFDYLDDPLGMKCPIGSHIRRANPRSAPVAGGDGQLHRLARRGIPYGPPFDPAHPDDGIERGLMTFIVNVDIADQFEFVMRRWIVGDTFAPGLRGTGCPISGVTAPDATFKVPVPGSKKPLVLTGFAGFVTTRASAYCFIPSLTALRSLAVLVP